MDLRRLLTASWVTLAPTSALASGASRGEAAVDTGVSGLWVLANFSYAGMRAQNSASSGWRIVAFIFGFPGTLVTYFAVPEGGQRAYGVQLPREYPTDAGP
jgi:hypothetical protein